MPLGYRALMNWLFQLKPPWNSEHLIPGDDLTPDSGRAPLKLLRHPEGDLVLRPYRHGGLRRFILPKLFLGQTRARREFEIHKTVWESGIPTLEPVGWCATSKVLPFLTHLGFLTRYESNLDSLTCALRNGACHREWVAQCADVLKTLFDRHIHHPDLNLNNWVLIDNQVAIIDFDGAQIKDEVPREFAIRCLARMARSGLKLGMVQHHRSFYRLLVVVCQKMQLEPRSVLDGVAKRLPKNSFREIRWRVSGGRR